MSDDPETARQIAELAKDTRPLLVLDVDDVVLEFLPPFIRFLEEQDLDLKLDSFKLSGNIRRRADGETVDDPGVKALIGGFFDAQAEWQHPSEGVVEALDEIGDGAEIVLLTAMPHRHREIRRKHLDTLGFPYPLLTTEMDKGPALRQLRGDTDRPIAFVDDLPRNLVSARAAVADAGLFHLVTTPGLRELLPPVPDSIVQVDSWAEATPMVAEALGLAPRAR